MNCPARHFDNPTGMSFCGKCAAALARACAACGFEIESQAQQGYEEIGAPGHTARLARERLV